MTKSVEKKRINLFIKMSAVIFVIAMFLLIIVVSSLKLSDKLESVFFVGYHYLFIFAYIFMMVGIMEVKTKKISKGIGFVFQSIIIVVSIFVFLQILIFSPLVIISVLIVGFIFIPAVYIFNKKSNRDYRDEREEANIQR